MSDLTSPLPYLPWKRNRPPQSEKRAVALANGGIPGEDTEAACAYCGSPGVINWMRLADGRPSAWVTFTDLTLDHVIPTTRGGANVASNIVLACKPCNSSKRNRTPEEW